MCISYTTADHRQVRLPAYSDVLSCQLYSSLDVLLCYLYGYLDILLGHLYANLDVLQCYLSICSSRRSVMLPVSLSEWSTSFPVYSSSKAWVAMSTTVDYDAQERALRLVQPNPTIQTRYDVSRIHAHHAAGVFRARLARFEAFGHDSWPA
jgi:hypothetical protein